MIDFYSQYQLINELTNEMQTIYDAMDISACKDSLKELTEKSHADDFWQDIEKAGIINKKITIYSRKIKKVEDLQKELADIKALLNIVEEMGDEVEAETAKNDLQALKKKISDLSIEALLKGPYDANNAILSLHSGAGGTEAQDWVDMLYRMYTMYADKNKYKVTQLDRLPGDEAGTKSVTFMVEGDNAYGYLKAEMGVHRLVRISPFNANAKRMTSFASLEVMPEVEDDADVVINPDDIRVDVFRSSGAGGQKVNKTDTAIRITHFPTGIVVTCQNERSQLQNKEVAFAMLKSKLVELQERERQEQQLALKGDIKKIEWGSQIRSYVFCPYSLVKDHRTNYENPNISQVMDGDLEGFINDYLTKAN